MFGLSFICFNLFVITSSSLSVSVVRVSNEMRCDNVLLSIVYSVVLHNVENLRFRLLCSIFCI